MLFSKLYLASLLAGAIAAPIENDESLDKRDGAVYCRVNMPEKNKRDSDDAECIMLRRSTALKGRAEDDSNIYSNLVYVVSNAGAAVASLVIDPPPIAGQQSGSSGSSGSFGSSGNSGSSGSSGNSGSSGSSGNSGNSGNSGSQGTQGTQGAQGSQGLPAFPLTTII
ncbi:hypothetical protein F4805DRAFT_203819 [Annulohypoxylon moriforme]|nr:hypothetical protein F4805DRAFT_203819 [Annulohypoxylon moriforme]